MIEYQETFFNKIKFILLYFVEFIKDSIIIPKKHLGNCAIGGPDWKSIIMIAYDKNSFPPMIGIKKYGLLIVKIFCGLKKKKKRLWSQISYFHS